MPTSIGLPDERAAQIRILGESMGLTDPDVIGSLIADAIKAGKLPDTLPGWSIERSRDVVALRIGQAPEGEYTLHVAGELADCIEEVVNGHARGTIDADGDYVVVRAGAGIKIAIPSVGAEKIVSRGVARDIARLIRVAAK